MMDNQIADIADEIQELLAESGICSQEQVKIREIRERMENQQLTVSVIGQFKRGKSTLVNGILAEKLLPVGIVPVTSVVTQIQYGDRGAAVSFENGVRKPIPFEEISLYVNEQENTDNHLGVSSVMLTTPAPFLKDGLTLVDTPGVGSVHKNNSRAAYDFVKKSDAVIFMLSVDSPINEIEIDFLKNAKEYAGKFYFVANKADIVDQEELEEYSDYCRKLLCRLMEVDQVVLLPVSAKRGDGLASLVELIQKDCRISAAQIMEESARRKLNDIIGNCLGRFQLYWRTLNMPVSSFDNKFKEMERQLAQLQARAGKDMETLHPDGGDAIRGLHDDLQIRLNEVKLQLSGIVKKLFDVEYHFQLEELDLTKIRTTDQAEPQKGMEILEQAKQNKDQFLREVHELCQELSQSLSRIWMYREKNSYTVARRIEDLNIATRRLKKLKDMLQ